MDFEKFKNALDPQCGKLLISKGIPFNAHRFCMDSEVYTPARKKQSNAMPDDSNDV